MKRNVLFLTVFLVTMQLTQHGLTNQTLPDFTLLSETNQPIKIKSLISEGKSLIIYVLPESLPAQHLINFLQNPSNALIKNRSILITGGLPKSDSIGKITTYRDFEEQAVNALNVTGSPTILGIQNGTIEWTLSGILNNPETLENIINSWFKN
jgi:hypothetical protein